MIPLACQVMQAKPKFVPQQFQKLVAFIGRRITGQAYTFLSLLQVRMCVAGCCGWPPKAQGGQCS